MRRLDITDLWWPYGHVAVMLGGFVAALIATALVVGVTLFVSLAPS